MIVLAVWKTHDTLKCLRSTRFRVKLDVRESLRDRQEAELDAILAIYPDAVEDLRPKNKNAWNVYQPPELKIFITPSLDTTNGGNVYCSLYLHIACDNLYPESRAVLSVENVTGIDEEIVKKLKKELNDFLDRSENEEVILGLIQTAKEFLHEYNQPPVPSLSQMREDALKQQMADADHLKNRLLEEEKAKHDQEIQDIEKIVRSRKPHASSERRRANLTVSFAEDNGKGDMQANSKIQSCNISVMQFTRVNTGGTTLAVYLPPNSERSGCFETFDVRTGMKYVAETFKFSFSSLWTKDGMAEDKYLKASLDTMSVQLDKELKKLSSSFETRLISFKHSNFQQPVAFVSNANEDGISLHVLTPVTNGITLDRLLKYVKYFDQSSVRLIMKQLLLSVQYLHSKRMYLGKIKLSDIEYSYDKSIIIRRFDLLTRLEYLEDTFDGHNTSSASFAIEDEPRPKDDALFCCNIGKELLSDRFDEVDPVMKEFFECGCDSNPESRLTVNELLSHRFITDTVCDFNLEESFARRCCAPQENDNSPILFRQSSTICRPNQPQSSTRGYSVYEEEFHVLEPLGEGGFGAVFKVRKKLDDSIYAVKCVKLESTTSQTMKRLSREVRALSRMKSDNVVRYFNSWIETREIPIEEETSSSDFSSVVKEEKKVSSEIRNVWAGNAVSFSFAQKFDEDFPPVAASGAYSWSTSNNTNNKSSKLTDDSSAFDIFDEDEQDDINGSTSDFDEQNGLDAGSDRNEDEDDDDDDIIFGSGSGKNVLRKTTEDEGEHSIVQVNVRIEKVMYIQMEYCERNTLSDIIRAGLLHSDPSLYWRYFREILFGLSHIHSYGLMHRDLKPSNIFISSDDHVKIGDFGLAVGIVESNVAEKEETSCEADESQSSMDENLSSMFKKELTAKVGTVFYVAPEINNLKSTEDGYNQKVDVYSLGIIFFEMTYSLPQTAMERARVLTNLRKIDCELPPQYTKELEKSLIQWLLKHNPTDRPNVEEILSWNRLPKPQLQDSKLLEMLRHGLSTPNWISYRAVVGLLFANAKISSATDFAYDLDFKKCETQHIKAETLFTELFESTGASRAFLPTVFPKSALYEYALSIFYCLDEDGTSLMLPHDLRVPFVRSVCKNPSSLTQQKRYAISKVYRCHSSSFTHPKETTEAIFDFIADPMFARLAESEVVSLVINAVTKFDTNSTCTSLVIEMNHFSLVKILLKPHGVTEAMFGEFIRNMELFKRNPKSGAHLKFFSDNNLNPELLDKIDEILPTFPIGRVEEVLRHIMSERNDNGRACKKLVKELEATSSLINSMVGYASYSSIQIRINLRLLARHWLYSGLIFQVIPLEYSTVKRPKILAMGGVYNELANAVSRPGSKVDFHFVGVTFDFEKFASLLQEEEAVECASIKYVYITFVGAPSKSQFILATEFLRHATSGSETEANVNVKLLYQKFASENEALTYCDDAKIRFVLIITSDNHKSARLFTLEKHSTKISDQKIEPHNLVVHMTKMDSDHSPSVNLNTSKNEFASWERKSDPGTQPVIDVSSIMEERFDKLATRKRHESLALSKVTTLKQSLFSKTAMEVIVTDLPRNVVSDISARLDLSNVDDAEFESSLDNVCELHPKKQNFIRRLCQELRLLRTSRSQPHVVLFSYKDSFFRLIY